jgi:hypothetical protein
MLRIENLDTVVMGSLDSVYARISKGHGIFPRAI